MTVEEVKKIIDEESLKGGNLFEKRKNKENEMVIMNVAEQWLVYATDESKSHHSHPAQFPDNAG